MPSALKYKPLPKPSPQSDPRYQRVMEQVKQGAKKTKVHPPAAKKAADAAKASKGPPNERLAAGKSKQVDKIKEAKEGKPEQSSFLEMLRAEIAKAMPKTLGETENFDSAADGMKSGLKGNVSQQKDKSTQDVSGASKQAPSPAGEAKAGGPVPKEPNPAAPKVDAAAGMPAPKSDADISLQDSKKDTDAQMKEAEVTPTQLQKANDPRFSAVIDAKQQVAQNADAGPAKFRAKEGAALTSAASQASSKAKVSAAAMVGVRSGGNAKVLSKQEMQKAKDEAARAKVTAAIDGLFAATKLRVEAKLASIDTEVNAMFDRGTEAALSAMKRFVNGKIRDYKIRRYLSIPLVGLARWVKDQFLNLPDEVNVFYEQGRQLFQAQMDALIVRVAALVELRLKEAKAEVAKGKQQIQDFVDKQPKELQGVAKEAQSKVSADFDSLEQGIDNKKNELASSLAQKYKEGFDKANEALKEIQDSNKGFVAAFAEKLAEVLKAIAEFKARLTAILRKGADTIKLIIADPLGFLGNLISAVKGGIAAFGANIWKHLKAGFMRWLLGNAPPGIEIPSDLSPGSVFKLVMGVLGITYEKMRAKAVKFLGPTAVTVIETLVKYVRALIEGGPAKLWEEIKADLSNLKEMVIGAFQDYLVTTIVQKAITKIVSMFNPAGAIIQAILAIVSIVQFVVEKAAQIMEFVESVINSIHAIATGSIGGAVKRIEMALANAVPLLIGFLAALLGLSGVSKKIREFIMKVQAKVDAAIDKALKKIVDKVKKLIGKLFGKGGKDKKDDKDDGKNVKAQVRGELAGKDLSNPDATPAIIDGIWSKYQPKGLKSLRVKRDKNDPKKYTVLASASLVEEVKMFNGKALPPALATIAQNMSPYSSKTTAYVYYDGGRAYPGSPFQNRTMKSGHKQHAEMKFLAASGLDQGGGSPPKIWQEVQARRQDAKKAKHKEFLHKKIEVRMDINRSPCDDCSAELTKAQAAHSQYVHLSINMVSMYATKASWSAIERTSQKSLMDMMEAGITLNALQIWDLIRVKAAPGKMEFTYAGSRERYPLNVASGEFMSREAQAAAILQSAADELNRQKKLKVAKGSP